MFSLLAFIDHCYSMPSYYFNSFYLFHFSQMEEIGSMISEGGASNESLLNTSSPNEVEVKVYTSKKRKVIEHRAACCKHFDKFTDESGASKEKCKYCGKIYAAATKGGRILDPFRSSLTPKLVQPLFCLQDWLRSEPIPINIEEDLEYLEQLKLVAACWN
ncbi:uncharacterized protein LOC129902655 isoform X2 [Solanum dulcamara]|uniref:uncharacterized protein LOC129902655 isoform X2 n=1 Tax=Solanum dulcamara TaxID=45834 RepID=UPI0024854BB4|nr:uncharacterized protein LOC129902655 isoform X2 [Solanum dulcamara]